MGVYRKVIWRRMGLYTIQHTGLNHWYINTIDWCYGTEWCSSFWLTRSLPPYLDSRRLMSIVTHQILFCGYIVWVIFWLQTLHSIWECKDSSTLIVSKSNIRMHWVCSVMVKFICKDLDMFRFQYQYIWYMRVQQDYWCKPMYHCMVCLWQQSVVFRSKCDHLYTGINEEAIWISGYKQRWYNWFLGQYYENKEVREGRSNYEISNLIHSKTIQGCLWF